MVKPTAALGRCGGAAGRVRGGGGQMALFLVRILDELATAGIVEPER